MRLQKAQENLQLEDEHAGGGQQSNELQELLRQRKRNKAAPQSGSAAAKDTPAPAQAEVRHSSCRKEPAVLCIPLCPKPENEREREGGREGES